MRVNGSRDKFLRLVSGQSRGISASLARGALGAASAVYGSAIRLRNRIYDWGLGVKRLPRPVLSIGNLTTGGTGKTPVACWLCRHLLHLGHRPAILMRGYKARPGELSDEQAMLQSLLARPQDERPITVHADPNRYRGGREVLARDEGTTVFILDDGFQHRRLARDFDLVLIDAISPFGFERILPRGLLREPIGGLRRASAILITHADQARPEELSALVGRLKGISARAPVYCCSHRHNEVRWADGTPLPLSSLAGRRFMAFAGIGQPEALQRQLSQLPGELAGTRWFDDHHPYTPADVDALRRAARDAGAQTLLTTEKDWVKIAPLVGGDESPRFARLGLSIAFADSDELELLSDIRQAVEERQ